MGNLCSIFHSRFKELIKVIPSTRKAQLMDYILLGWQGSSYKLKNSDKKWFMKPYSQIVLETGIPESSIQRYIKEFADEGFIERKQALYSRTDNDGIFHVKKGSYIYITDKFLMLLKPNSDTTEQRKEKDIPNTVSKKSCGIHNEQNLMNQICAEFENNEGTDSLILRESYIRDLYTSLNNNISLIPTINSVDKIQPPALIKQFEAVHELLFTEIKEEIPEEIKKLVAGTMFNLTFKHQKQWSNPQQVAAEYLFALINVEFYLPEVVCFKHRNNILSKLVRSNSWRTPKGFFKHFYLGQSFKDTQELREARWEQQKANEIKAPSLNQLMMKKSPALIKVEEEIYEHAILLEGLNHQILLESSEETITKVREEILTEREYLEYLYQKQKEFEYQQELEWNKNGVEAQLCA